MKVLVVEPGCLPYERNMAGSSEIKSIIGEHPWAIYPFGEKIALLYNDDMLDSDQPFNRSLPDGYGAIFGTFLLCGKNGNRFCSLSPEQMEQYKQHFCQAEVLLGFKARLILTRKVPAREKAKKHICP